MLRPARRPRRPRRSVDRGPLSHVGLLAGGLLALSLAGCGTTTAPTPSPTSTPAPTPSPTVAATPAPASPSAAASGQPGGSARPDPAVDLEIDPPYELAALDPVTAAALEAGMDAALGSLSSAVEVGARQVTKGGAETAILIVVRIPGLGSIADPSFLESFVQGATGSADATITHTKIEGQDVVIAESPASVFVAWVANERILFLSGAPRPELETAVGALVTANG